MAGSAHPDESVPWVPSRDPSDPTGPEWRERFVRVQEFGAKRAANSGVTQTEVLHHVKASLRRRTDEELLEDEDFLAGVFDASRRTGS